MKRARLILGVLAGVVLLASSVAHTWLGWKSIAERLAQTNVPPDLQAGLHLGWAFGGAAMVILAFIVLTTFVDRLRGGKAPLSHVIAIAVVYMAFGAWAIAESGGDLFFLGVFVVPGAMLGIAANGHDR
jgi:TRAP-type C4-dicarboxylate transport system permease small subunit